MQLSFTCRDDPPAPDLRVMRRFHHNFLVTARADMGRGPVFSDGRPWLYGDNKERMLNVLEKFCIATTPSTSGPRKSGESSIGAEHVSSTHRWLRCHIPVAWPLVQGSCQLQK